MTDTAQNLMQHEKLNTFQNRKDWIGALIRCNACTKLLSVCQLFILGLRKYALQKVALQGNRAVHCAVVGARRVK